MTKDKVTKDGNNNKRKRLIKPKLNEKIKEFLLRYLWLNSEKNKDDILKTPILKVDQWRKHRTELKVHSTNVKVYEFL